MINLLPVRDALLTALSASLGVYSWAAGQTPAIRIEDGTNPYTEEPTITGLECVLSHAPEVPIAGVFGGYSQTFSAVITLKQWDITATTLAAMEILLTTLAEQFPEFQMSSPTRVLRLTRLDNIETFSVRISQQQLFES